MGGIRRGPRTQTLEERFARHVDRNGPVPERRPDLGPCWLWTGHRDRSGYGRINVGRKPRGAHRVAWERVHGPLPEGLEPDHLCFTPPCVNEGHMEVVTREENRRRAVVARGWTPGVHARCGTRKRRTRGGKWVCGRCRVEKARHGRAIKRALREDW